MPEYKLEGINYDKNGNLQTLKRYAENVGGGSAHLMDDLTYKYITGSKNKLRVVEDGASNTAGYTLDIDMATQSSSTNYVYNEIGELTANTEEDKGFEYNAQGLVTRVFSLSTNANIAIFTYNDKGLRHRKTSYDANGNALHNTYYSYDAGGAQVASYTEDLTGSNPGVLLQDLHLYGSGRVGGYNAASGSALYELTDHLGNVRAVVKDNGSGQAETVSYTDYYPHGSIMPGRNYQSSLHFPYGYQGQEKDAETGLTNFELRQYDGRIGRWYNPDPMGQHHSPYLAMSNNPVSSTDPDGGWDGGWGLGYGGDDAFRDYMFSQGSVQNGFMNGDMDAGINAQENNALTMHGYNNYRANHTNENGEWGDWITGTSHTTYGEEMTSSTFSVNPNAKVDNPRASGVYQNTSYNYYNPLKTQSGIGSIGLGLGALSNVHPVAKVAAVSYGTGFIVGSNIESFSNGVAKALMFLGVSESALYGNYNTTAQSSYVSTSYYDKMTNEISRIMLKTAGPMGFQYALVARTNGLYENVRGGKTYLRAGEVWKYGETTSKERYSRPFLNSKGVDLLPQFPGSQMEIKIQEKIMIYSYFFMNGSLPPGNKIFR